MSEPPTRKALRQVAGWVATPVGLVLLWIVADALTSAAPGTALVIGLLGLLGLIVVVAVLYYVFR